MSTIWRKWSPGQRLSVVVIAVAVLTSIAWSYTAGTTESWQVLLEPRSGRNSDEFNELISLLDADGISWRLSQKAEASRFEIEVRAGLEYRKAFLLAAEHGLVDGDREDDLDQGLFRGGLTDTSEKSRLRQEQGRVRKMEKALRRYPGISTVDLVINHGKPGRYATDQDTPDTAVVSLQLKDPSTPLPARVAEKVRKTLHSAFGIKVENIEIIDSNMRDYPRGPAGIEAALARDRREEVRNGIRSFIERLYLGVFEKAQFRLGVFVDNPAAGPVGGTDSVPGGNSAVEDGTGADPSLAGGAESRPAQPAPSSPRQEPAPLREKYQVQVNLVLDISAVKKQLARRAQLLENEGATGSATGLAGRVESYEREQEELLARQLPHEDVRVTVTTEAFIKPQTEAAAPPGFFTGLFAGGWEFTWMSDPYISGGGGALVLAFLGFCLMRIRARRKRRLVIETAEAICSDVCRDTLEAVDEAGSLVRSSPDTSTAVVKMWLSESPDAVAEM